MSLRQAFAEGRTREARATSLNDRCVEFDDGTIWFPEGKPDAQAARAGPAVLFGLLLVTGTASLVLFVDGHAWAVPSLLGPASCVLCLGWLLRRSVQAEAAAEARVERGLVLLPDALVLRDPPHDERVERVAIEGFVVRHARRGGDKALPWVHVVRNDGRSEVPLAVTDVSLPTLEAWLSGSS